MTCPGRLLLVDVLITVTDCSPVGTGVHVGPLGLAATVARRDGRAPVGTLRALPVEPAVPRTEHLDRYHILRRRLHDLPLLPVASGLGLLEADVLAHALRWTMCHFSVLVH